MANYDNNQIIDGIIEQMPLLTDKQSQAVAKFLEDGSMELLNSPGLYTNVMGVAVGYWLEKFREWNFKNPIENLGVIRRGSNIGFQMQRIYSLDPDLAPSDPSFLKGPRNENPGKIQVPLKEGFKFESAFVPTNIAWEAWTTIWSDLYFSTAANDAGDRLMLVGQQVSNLYKLYDKYRYALESMLIAYNYDRSKLKDSQVYNVDIGASSYLQITGDGAMDFIQTIESIEYVGYNIGYKQYNEKSFEEYWNSPDDYMILVRPGLKGAIRKALMKGNYFSPDYVQSKIDRLVEYPGQLSPATYTLKEDGTPLYVVYSDDGMGVPLGLNATKGQTGATKVSYTFDSSLITITESNPEVFAIIIDKARTNWISGPGGEIMSRSTIYDEWNHCYDLILQTFGVNSGDYKIGASVFVDRTYPYIAFVNSYTPPKPTE